MTLHEILIRVQIQIRVTDRDQVGYRVETVFVESLWNFFLTERAKNSRKERSPQGVQYDFHDSEAPWDRFKMAGEAHMKLYCYNYIGLNSVT